MGCQQLSAASLPYDCLDMELPAPRAAVGEASEGPRPALSSHAAEPTLGGTGESSRLLHILTNTCDFLFLIFNKSAYLKSRV